MSAGFSVLSETTLFKWWRFQTSWWWELSKSVRRINNSAVTATIARVPVHNNGVLGQLQRPNSHDTFWSCSFGAEKGVPFWLTSHFCFSAATTYIESTKIWERFRNETHGSLQPIKYRSHMFLNVSKTGKTGDMLSSPDNPEPTCKRALPSIKFSQKKR